MDACVYVCFTEFKIISDKQNEVNLEHFTRKSETTILAKTDDYAIRTYSNTIVKTERNAKQVGPKHYMSW